MNVNVVCLVHTCVDGHRNPEGLILDTPWCSGLGCIFVIGLWLYDGLAGRHNVKRHRRLSRKEVMRLAPALVTENLKEGFIYYDGQTNDARLTMAVLRTAVQYGATVANYAEVTSFGTENGKVHGAHVRDHLGDQHFIVRARHIVNATGVFAE